MNYKCFYRQLFYLLMEYKTNTTDEFNTFYYQLNDDIFFQVPITESNESDNVKVHNILLCDASGSMKSYWYFVEQYWDTLVNKLNGEFTLILFSDRAKVYNETKTLKNIKPDFSSTNIIKGLEELREVMKLIQNKVELIRVFFITDGEDSYNDFEKKFKTFIDSYSSSPIKTTLEIFVLGITNNFPVYISQQIRANMHTGNLNIKNIYWAQSDYEQSLSEEFKKIGDDVKYLKQVTYPVPGKTIPYEPYHHNFFENDWIYTDIATTQNLGIINYVKPTYEHLLELFKQWISKLQSFSFKSNNNEQIMSNATVVRDTMAKLYDIYINTNRIVTPKMTFTERVINKQIKTKIYEYQSLKKIADNLASGQNLKYLSNVELANQLTGVHYGKFSERVFALKEYTDEQFLKDKNKFICIVTELLPMLENLDTSERCVITLDNLIETIRSEEFLVTLNNITSRYDFLQSIGITGNGALLHICDASQINPWLTQIKKISTFTSAISSLAIEDMNASDIEKNVHKSEADKFTVSIKYGNCTEEINCVIPLFNKKHAEILKSVITSNLFQLICTYNILKCAHIIDFNAHLGGLSSLFANVLLEPPSTWRQKIVNKIKYTAKAYEGREGIKSFLNTLWLEPSRAVISEIPNEKVKCESITKIMLMILISAQDKTPDDITSVVFHLWKEFIGRLIHNRANFLDWFHLETDELTSIKFTDVYNYDYTIPYCVKKIKKTINDLDIEPPKNHGVVFKIDELKEYVNYVATGNVNYRSLKVFTNSLGYDINDETLFRLTVHAILHPKSCDRTIKVPTYEECYKHVFTELVTIGKKEYKKHLSNAFTNFAFTEYVKQFNLEHDEFVKPLTRDEIITLAPKHLNVTNENFNEIYTFNPANCLLSNACMSSKCKYFLEPRKDFSAHMSQKTPNYIHSLHRTMYKDFTCSTITIIDNLLNGVNRPHIAPIDMKRCDIEKYVDDIEKLKDFYVAFYFNNDHFDKIENA